MKSILKSVFILALGMLLFQSCDNSSSNFSDTPTTGWVEFRTASSTTGQTSPVISIPLEINVPIYENGMNVNYSIEGVEGDFTQFVSSTTGSTFIDPVIETRVASIDVPLANMELGRDFVTSFDVTITSVSDGIDAGVDESSILVHRVTIPCSNPDELPSDYFIGEYVISDAVSVVNDGFVVFPDGTVTLTVGATPNERVFTNPQPFAPLNTNPVEVSILFDSESNTVTLMSDVDTGVVCGGNPVILSGAALGDQVPWDICNDAGITINYIEDSLGNCNGPHLTSFTLTKVE